MFASGASTRMSLLLFTAALVAYAGADNDGGHRPRGASHNFRHHHDLPGGRHLTPNPFIKLTKECVRDVLPKSGLSDADQLKVVDMIKPLYELRAEGIGPLDHDGPADGRGERRPDRDGRGDEDHDDTHSRRGSDGDGGNQPRGRPRDNDDDKRDRRDRGRPDSGGRRPWGPGGHGPPHRGPFHFFGLSHNPPPFFEGPPRRVHLHHHEPVIPFKCSPDGQRVVPRSAGDIYVEEMGRHIDASDAVTDKAATKKVFTDALPCIERKLGGPPGDAPAEGDHEPATTTTAASPKP